MYPKSLLFVNVHTPLFALHMLHSLLGVRVAAASVGGAQGPVAAPSARVAGQHGWARWTSQLAASGVQAWVISGGGDRAAQRVVWGGVIAQGLVKTVFAVFLYNSFAIPHSCFAHSCFVVVPPSHVNKHNTHAHTSFVFYSSSGALRSTSSTRQHTTCCSAVDTSHAHADSWSSSAGNPAFLHLPQMCHRCLRSITRPHPTRDHPRRRCLH